MIRYIKIKGQQGCIPSEALGKDLFSCIFQFLETAFFGLRPLPLSSKSLTLVETLYSITLTLAPASIVTSLMLSLLASSYKHPCD